jgi:prefoldin subunit 5
MLKPERVTFPADDDKFHQLAHNDQLNSFLQDSLVHYSTDFKKTDQQELLSIKHSNSLDELSTVTMSSQQQQPPPQQIEHEPPASAPPSLISEQIPILNENNLHQFDALTLQQLAIGSNINEENTKTSPSHSASRVDIQKEIDRVKEMKYGRTYSSPTSSLCSRLTINPFNGSNNNIDLSSITHSVHFTEQPNQTNRLPFSSTYITSIPESIVPASSSSTTNDNHFIPIHHIESPSLEDREVFETFHTKQTSIPGVAIRQPINSLNRNISTSETDLIASLHRSASKQALDNQSDHGTTYSGTSDDVIFIEWDKERNLFQDYINSLRTEIRVLLQERSEYQQQMETINNNLSEHKRLNITQINTDQTKLELLQKSLEEKNLVLEQLQKEYEIIKEKNTNLTRKISNLRCDSKAQTGVIDELKQKIAELTVDIQNHILVKRRLEISMMNLESDCQIIDAERIRLNNDIKDVQLSKQELEKLLQQANVKIAEQGNFIHFKKKHRKGITTFIIVIKVRMIEFPFCKGNKKSISY